MNTYNFSRQNSNTTEKNSNNTKAAFTPGIRSMYFSEVAKKYNWSLYTLKQYLKDAEIKTTTKKIIITETGQRKFKTIARKKLTVQELKKFYSFINI